MVSLHRTVRETFLIETSSRHVRILLINTLDDRGGAAGIARSLLDGYRRRSHRAWMVVGQKRSGDEDVLVIPNDSKRSRWTRACFWMGEAVSPLVGRTPGAAWLQSFFRIPLADPPRWWDTRRGKEDFRFPGTWRIPGLVPRPDLIHAHNLHGDYFDLRALPWLSRRTPLALTLHDAWLLSGHCAHSLECERWQLGCGQCPDLTLYPAVLRDATAFNWERKRRLYQRSRLFIATPSRWLMDKVNRSVLAPAVAGARVIPNGVDLSVFRPADRNAVRASLGIPRDAKVMLFAANNIRRNPYKDYDTMRTAVEMVASRLSEHRVLFIALGDGAPADEIGRAVVSFVPYQTNPAEVAAYYQAADVYLHTARADTFPTTILESLACGTPVVATAVGGIPEQVKGLGMERLTRLAPGLNTHLRDDATGVLVPPGDADGLAVAVETILSDNELRRQLGMNAASDGRQRYDVERQVDAYLAWYEEILRETPTRRLDSRSDTSRAESPTSAGRMIVDRIGASLEGRGRSRSNGARTRRASRQPVCDGARSCLTEPAYGYL
jgi:glycosyltransferase involved in cell wall biosynthesis